MVRAWAKPSSSLGPTRRRSKCIEDGTDRQDNPYSMSCLSAFPTQHHPPYPPLHRKRLLLCMSYWFGGTMNRKYLLDCSANGAKWADDVKYKLEL